MAQDAPKGCERLSSDAIDTLARSAADVSARWHYCAGARRLENFLRDEAGQALTPKGDPRTNVIDQGAGRTYALPPDMLQRLLALLDACRCEGTVTHFSERQGANCNFNWAERLGKTWNRYPSRLKPLENEPLALLLAG